MNSENMQGPKESDADYHDMLAAIIYKLNKLEATQQVLLNAVYEVRSFQEQKPINDIKSDITGQIRDLEKSLSLPKEIIHDRSYHQARGADIDRIENAVLKALLEPDMKVRERSLATSKRELDEAIIGIENFAHRSISIDYSKEVLLRVTRLNLSIDSALSLLRSLNIQKKS